MRAELQRADLEASIGNRPGFVGGRTGISCVGRVADSGVADCASRDLLQQPRVRCIPIASVGAWPGSVSLWR